jgi:hypothetical protein
VRIPVVATIVVPVLVTEEEEAAAAEAVPAAGEVPTTEQACARERGRGSGRLATSLPARAARKAEKADKPEKKEKK